jgi:hypothetical protein
MAKSAYTLLFSALVVLAVLVSPIIGGSRKLAKNNKHSHVHNRPVARVHSNHTVRIATRSAMANYGWLSAGATYYGAPNDFGSDG